MTPEEFQNKQKQDFAKQTLALELAFLATVKDAVGNMGVRIFEEGKNASGEPIGKYENTGKNKKGKEVGIYVPDNKSPRAGNHKGKTGETITTTYYESYQSFRNKQGRESGFVNLRLFGRLMSDFFNSPVSDKIPSEEETRTIKVNEFEYHTKLRGENVGKMKGAEAKYGKVFAHTKEERERFNRTLNFEINKRVSAIYA
jgi:hypothetical protein